MESPALKAFLEALRAQADLSMLALCVWREARGESQGVQTAVAFSILNRVARPSWWGKDVLSVVFKRLQYTSLTYTKDPQLITWPSSSDDPSWLTALRVASDALHGISENPVEGADSYYDESITAPVWTKKARCVAKLGRLRFYDTDHDFEAEG